MRKGTCVTKTVTAERKRRVTFSVRADVGAHVFLAGDFNNWSPTAKAMSDKRGDGNYTVVLMLASVEYQYKFVVNGTWCADPECPDWVTNEHGTLNSVRRID